MSSIKDPILGAWGGVLTIATPLHRERERERELEASLPALSVKALPEI